MRRHYFPARTETCARCGRPAGSPTPCLGEALSRGRKPLARALHPEVRFTPSDTDRAALDALARPGEKDASVVRRALAIAAQDLTSKLP